MCNIRGIRRACSYAATITTPEAPTEYSEIRATFAQDQQIVYNFTLNDDEMRMEEDGVIVMLAQEQTAAFKPSAGSPMGRQLGGPVYLQLRCYKSRYEAPGSKTWEIPVFDSENTEVMGS